MAGKLMHALQYDSYGGGAAGLKHVEVPVPSAKKDEVLIKVEAASLNPYDLNIQKGVARPFLPRSFPYIPGIDIAGEVVAVGPGAENFKTGDKVVAVLSASSGGGLAEFAVAKKSFGNRKNILITAASGGVGHYAVQLAKLGNTYVTATCGARNIEFVKSLGADEVLDYKTPEGAALKSPSGKKYDAVIHCVRAPGIPWSTFEPNLSENGKVIHISPSPGVMITFAVKKLTFSKKQLIPLIVTPNGEKLKHLVNLVKEGKLKTVIDSKHPLSKAEDAWAKAIDGHATGKIIVEP
ncbi:hypothetical protein DKX38_025695 [Salix brachista]|uniref:Enoyl reductase (ER) domain-containing protein n=1 Tax=Salix brachista TaxID=2182728 RepID=A0A5N5JRK9_9ROSI|nr:hypothetical protein DKX38_025695 [Salix brachista]